MDREGEKERDREERGVNFWGIPYFLFNNSKASGLVSQSGREKEERSLDYRPLQRSQTVETELEGGARTAWFLKVAAGSLWSRISHLFVYIKKTEIEGGFTKKGN